MLTPCDKTYPFQFSVGHWLPKGSFLAIIGRYYKSRQRINLHKSEKWNSKAVWMKPFHFMAMSFYSFEIQNRPSNFDEVPQLSQVKLPDSGMTEST